MGQEEDNFGKGCCLGRYQMKKILFSLRHPTEAQKKLYKKKMVLVLLFVGVSF